jgi:hypothetical protein
MITQDTPKGSSKTIVVTPESAPAGETSLGQQLWLKGVKTSSKAAGLRVFLNPTPGSPLTPHSKSYLGSVYFSHKTGNEESDGSFVLPLPKTVTSSTTVVIYPIAADGTRLSGDVQLENAQIKPVDNGVFN